MAVVLETNIKGIINGNGAALIQRKNSLVPISSKRHLQKAFLVMSLKGHQCYCSFGNTLYTFDIKQHDCSL